MFISTAYAQAAGGGDTAGLITSLLPMVLIFVVFYFLLIRPQQKKQKDHKAMLAAVRRGDKIVTMGGLVGTVTKVINDKEITVEIAEGTKVRVMRDFIANVLSKTEPADSSSKDEKKDEKKDDDTDAEK